MNAKLGVVTSPCPISETDPDGLRGRIEATGSQISQLSYIIDVLERTLEPVLIPEQLKGQCESGGNPEPARSELAELCHLQGQHVYAAHQRIAEIERRLKL